MSKWKVAVALTNVTATFNTEVEADSEEEAIEKAKAGWHEGIDGETTTCIDDAEVDSEGDHTAIKMAEDWVDQDLEEFPREVRATIDFANQVCQKCGHIMGDHIREDIGSGNRFEGQLYKCPE